MAFKKITHISINHLLTIHDHTHNNFRYKAKVILLTYDADPEHQQQFKTLSGSGYYQ